MKKKYMYKRPNFFQRNFSFAGKLTASDFWGDLVIRLIVFLCATILTCIVLVVSVEAETEELLAIMDVIVPIMGLIWLISIAAMSRRRLRDAGFSAKSYLWLLLPVVGWIVFLVRLCGKSV